MDIDPNLTVAENLKKNMISHVLWEEEAEGILDTLRTDKRFTEAASILNKKDYPIQIYAILWLSIEALTLEYMDKRKPRHFARPIFDRSHELWKQDKSKPQ